MDKIKSIFKGKIVEVIYKVDNRHNHVYYYNNPNAYLHKPKIYFCLETKEYKTFHKCETDKPPFEHGEEIYINELDLITKIEKRVRSVNGEYIYCTNYILEKIISEDSKKEAEETLEEEMVKYNQWVNQSKKKDKKWWKFWK